MLKRLQLLYYGALLIVLQLAQRLLRGLGLRETRMYARTVERSFLVVVSRWTIKHQSYPLLAGTPSTASLSGSSSAPMASKSSASPATKKKPKKRTSSAGKTKGARRRK